MGTNLKTAALAAMMMLASFRAAAEPSSPMLSNDPLMRQIMSRQLTQTTGGVTGAVRIGSGQSIALSFIDPLAPLKPADGLVAKPIEARAEKTPAAKASRKTRRADEQLRKMSDDKRAADWSGRK